MIEPEGDNLADPEPCREHELQHTEVAVGRAVAGVELFDPSLLLGVAQHLRKGVRTGHGAILSSRAFLS